MKTKEIFELAVQNHQKNNFKVAEKLYKEALSLATSEANASREEARREIDSQRENALNQLKKEADTVWRLIYTQTIDWEPFPMDEATQAMKDEIDSTAMIVRAHRERLLKDPFRPGYHFTVPEGVAVPFDPNGAIFWQGRYHLF